jgi:hypothetical protein
MTYRYTPDPGYKMLVDLRTGTRIRPQKSAPSGSVVGKPVLVSH